MNIQKSSSLGRQICLIFSPLVFEQNMKTIKSYYYSFSMAPLTFEVLQEVVIFLLKVLSEGFSQ